MESRYLSQSSDYANQERTSDFRDEAKDIEGGLELCRYPVQFLGGLVSVEGVRVISSRFSLRATLKAEKSSPFYKTSKAARIAATEVLRKAAVKAKKPANDEELQELVRSPLTKSLLPLTSSFSFTTTTQKTQVYLSATSPGLWFLRIS